ncbi:hypothetical protein TNIN_491191 [Trichonephila inaurata madagascariensis]|uniref:Uncharacterized protein n=1 Tax=Trichonephila inaurata madagascariensis TaxID=2747483 RepID=A0A8X6YGG6_9ARAC|nr:hypothetical protein TNIN_491191 [Trichonephila inaurata madagascariensis]
MSSTSVPAESTFVPKRDQEMQVALKALPNTGLLERNESSSIDSSDCNRCDSPSSIPTKRIKFDEGFKDIKDFDCSIENTSSSVLTPVPIDFKPDDKCDNATSKLESRVTGATARCDQTQYSPPNVFLLNNETHIPEEKDISLAFGGKNNCPNSHESNESLQNVSGNDDNIDLKNENNSEEDFLQMGSLLGYGYSGPDFVLNDLFGSLFDNNGRDPPPHDFFPDAEGSLTGNSAFQSANESECGYLEPEEYTLNQFEDEM